MTTDPADCRSRVMIDADYRAHGAGGLVLACAIGYGALDGWDPLDYSSLPYYFGATFLIVMLLACCRAPWADNFLGYEAYAGPRQTPLGYEPYAAPRQTPSGPSDGHDTDSEVDFSPKWPEDELTAEDFDDFPLPSLCD